MKENISNDKIAYQLMEITYIKSRGREVSWNPIVNSDLYPETWFSSSNYKQKTLILSEAIEKGILIKDTEGYKSTIEGVRKSR